MPATSLAEQLSRLSVPQTSQFVDKKKKSSLLFDFKEAANIDRDTFYSIGLEGLQELCSINSVFKQYKHSLFDISSQHYVRSVETAESNRKLDKEINDFLLHCSPYFRLKPTHKALEWLISRFQIEDYNVDSLILLALPYHETLMFSRVLQLINLKKNPSWEWLKPVKKEGVPLSKTALLNRAATDISFYRFVCDMPINATKVYSEKMVKNLTNLFGFYCTTIIGALEHCRHITDLQVSHLLPSLIAGLNSVALDYNASVFMILSYLATKTQLGSKLLERLFVKVAQVFAAGRLKNEAMLLLIVLCQCGAEVSEKALNVITSDRRFLTVLLFTARSNVVIFPLVYATFLSCLEVVKKKGNLIKESKIFIENVLNDIRFSKDEAEEFFRLFIENCSKGEIEKKTMDWFVCTLKNLEKQYPNAFDTIITDPKYSKTAKSLLGLIPAYVGQLTLFNKLHDPNAAVRANAVSVVSKQFEPLQSSWLSETILERLSDESPQVILAVLKLPQEYLVKLFPIDGLVEHLTETARKIWHQKLYGEWKESAKALMMLFCEIAGTEDGIDKIKSDRNIILTVAPYLLSNNTDTSQIILNSSLANRNKFLARVYKELKNPRKTLSEEMLQSALWKALNDKSCLSSMEEIMKFQNINSAIEKFIVILFAASAVTDNIEPTFSVAIMEWLNNLIQGTKLCYRKSKELNEETLFKIGEQCHGGELPLQVVQHLMCKLIQKTDFVLVQNPCGWYSEHPSLELLIIIFKSSAGIHSSVDKGFETFFRTITRTLCQSNFPRMEFGRLLCNILVKCPEIGEFCLTLLKGELEEEESGGQEGDNGWLIDVSPSNIIVPILLICLSSSNDKTRRFAVNTVAVINSRCGNHKSSPYARFLTKLSSWSEEIALDPDQLSIALYLVLSPDPTVQSGYDRSFQQDMTKVRNILLDVIVGASSPARIVSPLLSIFAHITSVEIMSRLMNMCIRILDRVANNDNYIGRDENLILKSVLEKIDSSILMVFEKEESWTFAEKCLKLYNSSLSPERENLKPPAVMFLEKISHDVFDGLPDTVKKKLIHLVVSIMTDIEIGEINSAICAMIKRIAFDSSSILEILHGMRDVKAVPPENQKVRRRWSHAPTLALLGTVEWRRGICLLELIQNKKKLTNSQTLLLPLFQIIKICLQFEEQSPVEYTKQLLLSTILHCCKKLTQENKTDEIPPHAIQVELIVECIRASQNPQTHHHALLVLSHVTSIKPDEVLHNMMAIFTFMGSSVLRLDDAYSFQIILKTIETVVPVLVQNIKEEQGNEEQVMEVLQVFSAAILDIPEHRRLSLVHKLLSTLSDDGHYLWLFICLVTASCVLGTDSQSGSDAEITKKKLEVIHDLCLEFSPATLLQTVYHVVNHVALLPHEKESGGKTTSPKYPKKKTGLKVFDVEKNTAKQLRHYRYMLLGFVSSLLSSQHVVNMMVTFNRDEGSLLNYFQQLVEVILDYMKEVSKLADRTSNLPSAKYWKAMVNITYDLLSKTNALLPSEMFLAVVGSLLSHNIPRMRRKVMELLNWQLQSSVKFEPSGLLSLLPPLLDIVRAKPKKTDDQLNRQTALISVKLLARLIAPLYPADFEQALHCVIEIISKEANNESESNEEYAVLASSILCTAELLSTLGYKSIVHLPKFMPSLISMLSTSTVNTNVPEFLLPSILTTLQKVTEYHSNFISPYLVDILTNVALLSALYEREDVPKSQEIVTKLNLIRKTFSEEISFRILLPAVETSYIELVNGKHYTAIPVVVSVLCSAPQKLSVHKSHQTFLLKALSFRNEKSKSAAVAIVEPSVISCAVSHVLKLNESEFTSFCKMLSNWDDGSFKTITFYKLIATFAETLKSLFVPFAKMFDRKASDILNKNNTMEGKRELYFGNDEKGLRSSAELVEAVLRFFLSVFKYDSEHYVTEKSFSYIMPALVNQLENKICIDQGLFDDLLIPCLANMATSVGDDSLWKKFNYQILLKTQHENKQIRLAAVKAVCEVAKKLGDSYLPLLPETIPYMAELLEDDEEIVEKTCRTVVQDLESILGEQISKYF